MFETPNSEGVFTTDRALSVPAPNPFLQGRIADLLKRPVGRPPNHAGGRGAVSGRNFRVLTFVRRYYASFTYQAGAWSHKRRVVAKVEGHPGELFPRVGFIVTNLSRKAKQVVAFFNQRGTAEQYIKEGNNALKWPRLSCRTMTTNAVRLQFHALAYNLSNFLRTLALP